MMRWTIGVASLACAAVAAAASTADDQPHIASPDPAYSYVLTTTEFVASTTPTATTSPDLSNWEFELGDWKGTPPSFFQESNAVLGSNGLQLQMSQPPQGSSSAVTFMPLGVPDVCACG
jgi:hypothetical protein